MPHEQAASIVALRNTVEEMMIDIANDPQALVLNPGAKYAALCSLIRALCCSNAGRYRQPAHGRNMDNRGLVIDISLLCAQYSYLTKASYMLCSNVLLLGIPCIISLLLSYYF